MIPAMIATGSVLLFGGMVVVMSVAGQMDGRGMHRSGGGAQTPVADAGPDVAVDIRDFDYLPRDLTIDAGATVTWTNYDGAPHTSSDKDGAWDTGRLNKDQSGALTFDEPGAYSYFCTYHPYMKATLTVR
jgi:plastocyanin